jgi:pimeloyl-ACP methyl ester carboxylesterase
MTSTLQRRILHDGSDTFEVSSATAKTPMRTVLFLVGGGGNPERHAPLLVTLADAGCNVVAPHFAMLASPSVDEEIFRNRIRRAQLALDSVSLQQLPVVGIGHSLGATALLALAGARAWLGPSRSLDIPVDSRLTKLLLFAPALGFFEAPNALDSMHVPLELWTGTEDALSPPAASQRLARALPSQVRRDLHVAQGAGHFSFMHVGPPNAVEPLADKAAFLTDLVRDVVSKTTT